MQFGRGKPANGAFYDSDFTTIDSVLAQGLLHGLQSKGDCRVAIVTMSRPNLAVAGFTDSVERYYRGPAGNFAQVPPAGMRTEGAPGPTSPAFTEIFTKTKPDGTPLFQNHVKRILDTGDPNTLFRNYLEAQYDNGGFFILSGPATNLASALGFRGMKELITAKITHLTASCNIKADIPAAKKLFAEWPTPISLVSDELAAAILFPGASIDKEFVTANPDSPFVYAYKAWKPMPYDTPAPAMSAVLHAARPKEGYFKVSDPGSIMIHDDGKTMFTASAAGKHQMLLPDPDKKDKVIAAWVDLTSAKPVIQQRFRPPVAADNKKADPAAPEKKP